MCPNAKMKCFSLFPVYAIATSNSLTYEASCIDNPKSYAKIQLTKETSNHIKENKFPEKLYCICINHAL